MIENTDPLDYGDVQTAQQILAHTNILPALKYSSKDLIQSSIEVIIRVDYFNFSSDT
jgi:hypothetical protein